MSTVRFRRVCAWLLTTAVAAASLVLVAPDAGASPSPGSEWISRRSGEQIGYGGSVIDMTADGQVVVVNTTEPLVAGDTNGITDAYAFDRTSDTLTWISESSDGGFGQSVAADAPVVAWVSVDGHSGAGEAHVLDLATGLDIVVAASENFAWGLYVDLSNAGTTALVHVVDIDFESAITHVDLVSGMRTEIASGSYVYGSLSGDGTTIAYRRYGDFVGPILRWRDGTSEVVAGSDGSSVVDIDRSGNTILFDRDSLFLWSDGASTDLGSLGPWDDITSSSLSADGSRVTFAGWEGRAATIEVLDVATMTTTALAVPSSQINSLMTNRTGTTVAFQSTDAIVPGVVRPRPPSAQETNETVRTFLYAHDISSGTTVLVCCPLDGHEAADNSGRYLVGDDGSVAFSTWVNIDPDDDGPGASLDTYLWNRPAAAVALGAAVADESDGTASIPVTLTEPASSPVRITVEAIDGCATTADAALTTTEIEIPIGATTGSIPVSLVDDADVEGDEVFQVRAIDVDGAAMADLLGEVTIRDDDSTHVTPTLSVADESVIEGDDGTTPLSLTVSLSEPTEHPVTFRWSTSTRDHYSPTNAEAFRDYEPTSAAVTIPAGSTTTSITVPIDAEYREELDEHFDVLLSDVCGATVADDHAVATIVDDDTPAPHVTIADASGPEGHSGRTPLEFTITLSSPAEVDSELSWRADEHHDHALARAKEGQDFVRHTGPQRVVMVPAGATTATIAVELIGDHAVESDEVFVVYLWDESGDEHLVVDDAMAIGTIVNDDDGSVPEEPPVVPALRMVDTSVREDRSAFPNVRLSEPTTVDVEVTYTTADRTAVAGSDYVATTRTITILAGETVEVARVNLINDSTDEVDERFDVQVTEAVGATIVDGLAVVTIRDDDPPVVPDVSIGDAEADEADHSISFPVTLSEPTTVAVSVEYATEDGTARRLDDYFGTVEGSITIPAGATQHVVSIGVFDDGTHEPDEDFEVVLIGADRATIVDDRGTGTIYDDDPIVVPKVSVGDAEAAEADGTIEFPVTLSEPTTVPVQVHYATSDGSATNPEDYETANGSITVPAGETDGTISVVVTDDDVDEVDEAFTVELTDADGATVDGGEAIGTIHDDDEPVVPDVVVGDAEAVEGDRTIVFPVTLSEPTTGDVEVSFTTGDGTSSNGAVHAKDYRVATGTLRIAAGEMSGTISVTVIDDVMPELDERFRFLLTDADGATIVDQRADGTIHDDDPARMPRVI